MSPYYEYSDIELLTLLKSFDPNISKGAFAIIYHRFRKPSVIYTHKMLSDIERAKDISQEIFTLFFHQRQTIIIKTSISDYLSEIVCKKVYDDLICVEKFRNTELTDDLPICLIKKSNIIEREIEQMPVKMMKDYEIDIKKSELKLAGLVLISKQ